MKNRLCTWAFCFILMGWIASCNSAISGNDAKNEVGSISPTPSPSNTVEANRISEDASVLCNGLTELKKIPYRDPRDSDPIYDALVAKGERAVPCLIEKITDTRFMKDPREAPPFKNYRVGDTAVFVLLDITKQSEHPEKMLPPEYAKLWETEGIYAYFTYVERPENRRKIQQWWKSWARDNLKR